MSTPAFNSVPFALLILAAGVAAAPVGAWAREGEPVSPAGQAPQVARLWKFVAGDCPGGVGRGDGSLLAHLRGGRPLPGRGTLARRLEAILEARGAAWRREGTGSTGTHEAAESFPTRLGGWRPGMAAPFGTPSGGGAWSSSAGHPGVPIAGDGGATTAASTANAGRTIVARIEVDEDADGTIDSRMIHSVTYDARADEVLWVGEWDRNNDGTIDGRWTWTSTYDARGNRVLFVSEDDFAADGTIDRRETSTSTYDARGNEVQVVREVDWDANGVIESREKSTSTYDGRGNLVLWAWERARADGLILERRTETYTYDRRGNRVLEVFDFDWNGDGVVDWRWTDAFTYDPRGNPVLVVRGRDWNADGTTDSRATSANTFDARGNWVSSVWEIDSDVDGIHDSRITYVWTYDARGNLVLTEVYEDYSDETNDVRVTEAYTYRTAGDLVRAVTEVDLGVDGTIDYRSTKSYEYQGSGRPVQPLASSRPALETGPAESRLALEAGAPNPFRDLTTLRYALPEAGQVELRIYDAAGRRVRTLAEGAHGAGEHRVVWDGRDEAGRPVGSGAYFIRLRVGDREVTRRVLRLW